MHALVSHTRLLTPVFGTLVSQQFGAMRFSVRGFGCALFCFEVNHMSWSGFGTSFLDQVKRVILTDKETLALRERFEAALAEEIATWVLRDWQQIQQRILERAAKREFSVVTGGMCIEGDFLFDGEWRAVENAQLRKLYVEIERRGLLSHYFDVEFSEQFGFAMRLCYRDAALGEGDFPHTYRVCTWLGNSYVTQLMELARRSGVLLLCHDAPVCVSVPVTTVSSGRCRTLRFSYSVVV